MALHEHAVEELRRLRGPDPEPDEMQDAVERDILALVDLFADQGHSGSSAPYVIGALSKLLAFEPLTPLTGEDSEWNHIHGATYQNRRASHVFRERRPDGSWRTYDIEGRIFREPSGVCYTSRDSIVEVTFPYTPARVYVDVPARGDA